MIELSSFQPPDSLIAERAPVEFQILKTDFVAPVLRESYLRIRVDGVLCQLLPEEPDFEGWGLFRPSSLSQARRLEKTPDETLISAYLSLFPSVSLVLHRIEGGIGYGSGITSTPSQDSDCGVQVEGLVPVHLIRSSAPGRVIRARFDGSHFWFDPEPSPALEEIHSDPSRIPGLGEPTQPSPSRWSAPQGTPADQGAAGWARFQALGRRYRVPLSQKKIPMISGAVVDPKTQTLREESLAGVVHRTPGGGGFLRPTPEFTAKWR